MTDSVCPFGCKAIVRDGTCGNPHCASNRETMRAPSGAATVPECVQDPDRLEIKQISPIPPDLFRTVHRTEPTPPPSSDFPDEEPITHVETPQGKQKFPERTQSGTLPRVPAPGTDDQSKTG